MKKILLTALAVLAAVVGSACGAGQDLAGDSAEGELVVVGMSQVGAESD